jgi:hypothetical protein
MHHLGVLHIIPRIIAEKCCSSKIKATDGNWVGNCEVFMGERHVLLEMKFLSFQMPVLLIMLQ